MRCSVKKSFQSWCVSVPKNCYDVCIRKEIIQMRGLRAIMKRPTKVFLALFLLIVGLTSSFNAVKVFAADSDAQSSSSKKQESGFSIQAIIPSEQENQKLGYFDMNVEPNTTRKVGVRMFNTGLKPITVTVQANNAYTSNNGSIAYNKYNQDLYQAKTKAVSDLVQDKREKKVTIEPNGYKEAYFTIKMPEESYQGIILGAVTATAAVTTSKSEQITINNRVAYSLGIVLREGDTGALIPKFSFGTVRPKAMATETGVNIAMTNSEAINAPKMTMKTKFYRDKKLYKTINQSSIEMAPYSHFEHFIPIKLKAGNYTLKGEVQSTNGGYGTFTKRLTVTKAQAKKKTRLQAPAPKQSNLGWIILFIALGIIVLAVAWIGIYYFAMSSGKQKRAARKDHHQGKTRQSRSNKKR